MFIVLFSQLTQKFFIRCIVLSVGHPVRSFSWQRDSRSRLWKIAGHHRRLLAKEGLSGIISNGAFAPVCWVLSTFAIVLVWIFLRQWTYCWRTRGMLLSGMAKLHSVVVSHREIVGDGIFSQVYLRKHDRQTRGLSVIAKGNNIVVHCV